LTRIGVNGHATRYVNIREIRVLADRVARFPYLLTLFRRALMTRVIAALAAIGGMLISTAASAQLELAKQKNCLACHTVDKKLVGPAYKDVAKKYENDKDAAPRLAKKVREGGVGVWGQIPMPANPQVNEAESLQLVKWVLSLK
jgi:cytochrome c